VMACFDVSWATRSVPNVSASAQRNAARRMLCFIGLSCGRHSMERALKDFASWHVLEANPIVRTGDYELQYV
jgi:hypothetical protein